MKKLATKKIGDEVVSDPMELLEIWEVADASDKIQIIQDKVKELKHAVSLLEEDVKDSDDPMVSQVAQMAKEDLSEAEREINHLLDIYFGVGALSNIELNDPRPITGPYTGWGASKGGDGDMTGLDMPPVLEVAEASLTTLKGLLKISNELDKRNLIKEADFLDSIIKKKFYRIAQNVNQTSRTKEDYLDQLQGLDDERFCLTISEIEPNSRYSIPNAHKAPPEGWKTDSEVWSPTLDVGGEWLLKVFSEKPGKTVEDEMPARYCVNPGRNDSKNSLGAIGIKANALENMSVLEEKYDEINNLEVQDFTTDDNKDFVPDEIGWKIETLFDLRADLDWYRKQLNNGELNAWSEGMLAPPDENDPLWQEWKREQQKEEGGGSATPQPQEIERDPQPLLG
jgi:hypothetical protein